MEKNILLIFIVLFMISFIRDRNNKKPILVLFITGLLIGSFFMWENNHLKLVHPDLETFRHELMEDHPKIKRVETYMFRTFMSMDILYDDTEISTEELLEIREELKATFTLDFIKELGYEYWRTERYPDEFDVRIYLGRDNYNTSNYAYSIGSRASDSMDGNKPLDKSDNLFRRWVIAPYLGDEHIPYDGDHFIPNWWE